MHKHHEDSIKIMAAHFRKDPDIIALYLIGSVATGTERIDSDLDGVAILTDEGFEKRAAVSAYDETVRGHCTYPEGYFDIHYMSLESLKKVEASGSEPMRNRFSCASELFCDDKSITELVMKIPVFQKSEAEKKQLSYYCTMAMFSSYFLKACKADGFMRFHIADGMIYNLYKLILLENEVLFPSTRKLEPTVISIKNKPDGIVEKCRELMKTLSEECFDDILNSYHNWTSYDYPKNHGIIMNNFRDPYDWG